MAVHYTLSVSCLIYQQSRDARNNTLPPLKTSHSLAYFLDGPRYVCSKDEGVVLDEGAVFVVSGGVALAIVWDGRVI